MFEESELSKWRCIRARYKVGSIAEGVCCFKADVARAVEAISAGLFNLIKHAMDFIECGRDKSSNWITQLASESLASIVKSCAREVRSSHEKR